MLRILTPVLIITALIGVLLYSQKVIMRKKYIDFLSGLGWGEIILESMTTKELHAFYTFITQYSRKGIKPVEGSDLDKTLLQIARKYEVINYI